MFTSTEHNAKEIERCSGSRRRSFVSVAASSLTEADVAGASHSLTSQYFVAVGAFDPRKNLLSLIESFERLVRLEPGFSLHLVGGSPLVGDSSGPYEASLRERIARSPATESIVVHRDLDRADTIRLIRHATALALPSLAEGFGLPIIEALALGTPVVASDLPEIRSWAGDAIGYASPHEPADWVEPLLASAQTTEEQRRAGQGFASAYRWKACANALLEWWETAADPVGKIDGNSERPGEAPPVPQGPDRERPVARRRRRGGPNSSRASFRRAARPRGSDLVIGIREDPLIELELPAATRSHVRVAASSRPRSCASPTRLQRR